MIYFEVPPDSGFWLEPEESSYFNLTDVEMLKMTGEILSEMHKDLLFVLINNNGKRTIFEIFSLLGLTEAEHEIAASVWLEASFRFEPDAFERWH